MAKPKIVKPTGNKPVPKDHPVDRYPYMAVKPAPAEPQYFATFDEAVKKLRSEIFELVEQFKHLTKPELRASIPGIISAIGRIPRDGGKIDMELDPETGIRYRVELVRRRAA